MTDEEAIRFFRADRDAASLSLRRCQVERDHARAAAREACDIIISLQPRLALKVAELRKAIEWESE